MNEHEFFREMREQILDAPVPVGRRLSLRRHGLKARERTLLWPLAGVSLALAATLTLLVLALGAGSDPAPAYAVTTTRDHDVVTIYLREFRDIGKLNARLAALGTRIRAVPVISGCVDPVHTVIGAYDGVPAHLTPGPAKTLQALPPQSGILVFSETIENDTLPGRTFVIPVTRSGRQTGFATAGADVVIGPAPLCVAPELSRH